MNPNLRPQSCNGKREELNLPYGYKFEPTDAELLEFYLFPKLKGEKLPLDYVMDVDVYGEDPHKLPLNQFKHAKENQAYFFTEDLRTSLEGESQVLTTPNGSWKVYKDNVPICGTNLETIGFKTKLLFHDSDGNKTDWKMIEYRCHPDQVPTGTSNMKNYIVCKVMLKEKVEEDHLVEESPEEENGINGDNSE